MAEYGSILKVKGSTSERPTMPPSPGMIPMTRPSTTPTVSNSRRPGEKSTVSAVSAAWAMPSISLRSRSDCAHPAAHIIRASNGKCNAGLSVQETRIGQKDFSGTDTC